MSAGVSNLKRKTVSSSADDEELDDLKFNLLSAALDGFIGFNDLSDNIDHTLIGDIRHVGDHVLGGGFGGEGNRLESGEILSENDEAVVALASDVVDSGSNQDFLALFGLIDVLDDGPYSVGPVGGSNEGVVSI